MKYLRKFIEWGLLFSLLSPLIISKNLLFPFVSAKGYFFYLIMDIVLAGVLIFISKNKIGIPRSRILIFYFILILSKIILDVFGLSFHNSFWGNYERMMGIYTWLHLSLFFLLLVSFFDTKQKYFQIFNTALAVSGLVAIYGILQKLGIYFWVVIPGDARVYATLGNAAYLAGYLLLHLYIAGYLFFSVRDFYWRIFYATVFILDLMVLLFTATRSALLALFASFIFAIFYLIFFKVERKIKLVAAGSLMMVILLVSLIFVFKQSSFVENNLTLSRIANVSFSDATVRSRLLLWKTGLEAWRDRPIFGYGENNIKIAMDKYYNVGMVEDWADSTHNQFIDELVAHGVAGFILYVSFFVFLIYKLFQYRRSDFRFNLFFSGAIVAYCVNNLFLFESLVNFQFFIVLLGYVVVADNADNDNEKKKFIGLPPSISLALASIIFVGAMYINWLGISPMRDIVNGSRMFREDAGQAILLLEKAQNRIMLGQDNFTAKLYGDTVSILNNPGGASAKQILNILKITTDMTKKSVALYGDYSFFYLNLAKIYQQAASFNPQFLEDSFKLLEKAKGISPNRVDTYFAMAQGEYLRGNYIEAENILYDSLRLHAREAQVYVNLVEVQIRKGDPRKALENLSEAVRLGQSPSLEQLESYAQILVKREKWNELLQVLFMMDGLRPNNENIYSNILLAYKKLGDKNKIAEWAEKIKNLNK